MKYGPQEAVRLARSVEQLWVARGKHVRRVDLKQDQPTDEELVKLLLGPSGNLRAPALRRGKKLLVGFHPDSYRAELLDD